MAQPRPRSAGVTAAATYAVLCSAVAFFYWAFTVLRLLNAPHDDQGRSFYESFPVAFFFIALIPPAIIGAAVRIAVGLFQRRPWARVTSMIGAGVCVAVCLGFIAFRPFQTFVIPQHFVSQVVLTRQMASVSMLIMLLPVSIWWLFYVRTRNVKEQFAAGDFGDDRAVAPAIEKI
jgi:hypothetical protein